MAISEFAFSSFSGVMVRMTECMHRPSSSSTVRIRALTLDNFCFVDVLKAWRWIRSFCIWWLQFVRLLISASAFPPLIKGINQTIPPPNTQPNPSHFRLQFIQWGYG